MHKVIGFFVTLLLSLSIIVVSVQAQSPRLYYDWSTTTDLPAKNVLGATTQFKQYNNYLIGRNLIPSNPLYFVKRLQEGVRLAVTTKREDKIKLQLEFLGSRLDELNKLVESKNKGSLAQASEYYEQELKNITANLETLKKNKVDVAVLTKTIDEETAKHNILLEQNLIKTPDENKSAVEVAVKSSQQGMDKIADLQGKTAVPPDVVDRIQALKAQGLLTPEEAAKLIGVKTRTEARGELQKYVSQGVLPDSDFMRLNENVKTQLPDEFYKIHEIKRFYELDRLEKEKPDTNTLANIQEFAKTYKQGDVIPADIRRYWVPVIRLEEIQNTLRPDLIDSNLMKDNKADLQKFDELVERFKPRPEDLARLAQYSKNNPKAQLPPEYQRMLNLGQRYGAQCGIDQHWIGNEGQGYCISNDIKNAELAKFDNNKSCGSSIISAKNSTGSCGSFPADCLPLGWTVTTTCVQSQLTSVNSTNSKIVSCPSNSHFVPIGYHPDGGYCIPNYTTTNTAQTGNTPDQSCTFGYHRNYQGGPCLPDYNTTTGPQTLPPVSVNPGSYPNPYYPNPGQCGNGYSWVPEVISARGGYCAPNNMQDFPNNTVPGASGCRPPANNACPSGQHFNYTSCNCVSAGTESCTVRSCPSGMSWSTNTCDCRTSSGDWRPPSTGGGGSCQPPATGCGSYSYYDYGICSCRSTTTYPQPSTSPAPTGYGPCGSGLYWNGNACVSSGNYNSPSREQQESACRAGGGTCVSWVNNACGCERSGPTTVPNPDDPGEQCRRYGGNWSGSACAMPTSSPEQGCRNVGGTWTGSSCNMPTKTPEQSCQSSNGSWNGSTCIMPTSSPEQGCRNSNGEWRDNTCIMPTRSPEESCRNGGGEWRDNNCVMPSR